jgi:hypothetical protein
LMNIRHDYADNDSLDWLSVRSDRINQTVR